MSENLTKGLITVMSLAEASNYDESKNSEAGRSESGKFVPEGRFLIIGFGTVITLLFLVGVVGWFILSGQSRSFDRFSAEGDLLELMDDARLFELTFTRDETTSSVISARRKTQEAVSKAQVLLKTATDKSRIQRLDEVISAVQKYQNEFSNFVELRQQSKLEREAMVRAAVKASESSAGLQKIQEKYIRLDTEAVRQFRQQVVDISENSANSYEIVIFAEQARENEKNFILSKGFRELELAKSQISKLTETVNELKQRIRNPRSIELLDQIDREKDAYLDALSALGKSVETNENLSLSSKEVVNLDRAAFAMRDTAFALRSNERSVLSQIQRKVADTQELMARRLSLSEEVDQILIGVSDARQSDRDFSLATTDGERKTHADRVNAILADVINRARKIGSLLIENDEKSIFQDVLPSIGNYRSNFNDAIEVTLKASETGRSMVLAALEVDRLLNEAQSSRLADIAEAKAWTKVLVPAGIVFAIGLLFLAFLMRKSQQTLFGLAQELRISKDKAEEATFTAEEATKAKANFLATMSHEIRTPMNGVIGMIDLLGDSKLDDDQQQMVNTVKSSAYSLLTIINDILDFSKIEAGKLDLEEIPISVSDALEGVCEALAVNARDKNLRLCAFVDPDIPQAVIGDQVRLRQILFNLGGNAIKFTETGKVLIRADRVPGDDENQVTVRLEVIDEGIGIPEEAQKTLFQAFSQVDASTTRRFGGTGLGLSISQRLTELMGGAIGVNSVEGEGSTFHATITFPIAGKHNFKRTSTDLKGLRVLLALSDPEMESLLPRYLQHWNAKTEITHSMTGVTTKALAAVEDNKPFEVIVLDSAWKLDDQIALVENLGVESNLSAKFVILCQQRGRKERKKLDNAVYLDADPIQRESFIHIVAVAGGLVSPDVEYDDMKVQKDPGKAPSVEEAAANGQLILLAEDNLTNQDVIKRQLAVLGYAVEIANDGVEALERISTRSYAVLLCDCHMPNLDGFEVAKSIRKSESGTPDHLPIIAVTASVMKEETDSCFASGMDAVLAKPLEMDKLRTALRKWMPENEVSSHNSVELSYEASQTRNTDGDILEKSEPVPTPSNEGEEIDPIDLSALTNVFGDDMETLREILKEFVEPSISNVNEIESSCAEGSAKGVAMAAHKLKSSARSVGANKLADLCQALEVAGNAEDWPVIQKETPYLSPTIQKVIEYINCL
ncbi:MAG: response regulator [Alphaproteobacteria bacterium]|nr:response regulator [Alphaproteobacteria bacterium]MBT4083806.1 response regulator [Alphaproteobacteria bacterium]MBT7746062.1 response regulator [Alphaproteobacteria bacterium]